MSLVFPENAIVPNLSLAVSEGTIWPQPFEMAGLLPEVDLIASLAGEVEGDDDAVLQAFARELDEAEVCFRLGQWRQGMQLAHHAVRLARRKLSGGVWKSTARPYAVAHPVRTLIHEDPFTRRSFEKPRGYAGDAVLIDYIYGIDHAEHDVAQATPLGRWLFNYTSNSAAPRGVRRRMQLIAEYIDLVSAEQPNARILSIACGHMRELGLSHAAKSGLIGDIVAFDQDPLSLAEVAVSARRLATPVKCVEGSVARLIAGRPAFADFDLVYAAGLFDYLDVRIAKRLTRAMFTMLRPGGRMLIPNVLPGIYDMGYMETYMGWDLIYRDRADIEKLAADLTDSVDYVRYFEEAERNIGFLLVKKSSES